MPGEDSHLPVHARSQVPSPRWQRPCIHGMSTPAGRPAWGGSRTAPIGHSAETWAQISESGGMRGSEDFKNAYADLMFLADLGLIELKEEGRRKTLIPIVRFAGIEVDLGAAA